MLLIFLGGSTVAYIDQLVIPHTIRHRSCDVVIPHTQRQCTACRHYRKSLQAMVSNTKIRQDSHSHATTPSSHINYRYLTSSEKDERMHALHQKVRTLTKQFNRLKEKVESLSAECGVCIGEDNTTDLLTIMKSHSPDILSNMHQVPFSGYSGSNNWKLQ